MGRFVVYSEITFHLSNLGYGRKINKKFISILNYDYEEIEEKYFKKDSLMNYNNENTKISILEHLEYIQ